MSRVQEIVYALRAADKGMDGIDKHRWVAARGIWEELQEGRTQMSLAKQINRSQAYVFRYARCWTLVHEIHDNGSQLPPFTDILNSNEVRGPSHERFKADGDDQRGRHANPPEHTPPDPREGIATWIASADQALDLVAEHTVAWEFLTLEDLRKLRGLRRKVDDLVEALGSHRRKASV